MTLKNNIGSSEIIDKAITSGKINAYPEYTGVIVTELAHGNGQPGARRRPTTRRRSSRRGAA